jgi:hypothetical protein
MADLALNVTILDVNVPKAASAFLRKHPIPQTVEGVDDYPNTRAWVEAWLAGKLLREINKGIEKQAHDVSVKLTKDIFE